MLGRSGVHSDGFGKPTPTINPDSGFAAGSGVCEVAGNSVPAGSGFRPPASPALTLDSDLLHEQELPVGTVVNRVLRCDHAPGAGTLSRPEHEERADRIIGYDTHELPKSGLDGEFPHVGFRDSGAIAGSAFGQRGWNALQQSGAVEASPR